MLPLAQISKLEKVNTLLYFPNALNIVMADGHEYFFGSFIDRDYCFSLISGLSEVQKKISQMEGIQNASTQRSLEFGYQAYHDIFGGGYNQDETNSIPDTSKASATKVAEIALLNNSTNEQALHHISIASNSSSLLLSRTNNYPVSFSAINYVAGSMLLLEQTVNSSCFEMWRSIWLHSSSFW